MILKVAGQAVLYLCSECQERWVGQDNEPRTQLWQRAHSVPHRDIGGLKAPGTPNAPVGFGRQVVLTESLDP